MPELKQIVIKIILVSFFMLLGRSIEAQNLMHYTDNPAGEMPIKLFPEIDGLVQFDFKVDTDMNSEDILDNVEDIINRLAAQPNYKFSNDGSGRRSLSYKVEISFGREPLALYPVWIFNRSATKVKFNCYITVRDGKYKFSLTNFETNRNTIRGEAKNDGDPNIIQWQRVNSLLKERQEEIREDGKNQRKAREIAFDYNLRIAYECMLYTQERNLLQTLIDNLIIAGTEREISPSLAKPSTEYYFNFDMHELADTDLYKDMASRFSTLPSNHYTLDLQPVKIHVSSGEENHEIAGRNEIIKSIIVDKAGQITSNQAEADYKIHYRVDTSGRDKAIITIYNRNGDLIGTEKHRSSESDSDNRKVAHDFYKHYLSDILKSKSSSKQLKNIRMSYDDIYD